MSILIQLQQKQGNLVSHQIFYCFNFVIKQGMSFQQLTYPRRKNFIKNLNILLDTSPVLSPEKSLATRLLHKNLSDQSPSKRISPQRSPERNPIKVVEDKKLFSLRKHQQKKQQGVRKYLPSRSAKSAHLITSGRNFDTSNPLQQRKLESQASLRRKLNTQGSFMFKKAQVNINDQFEGNIEFVMSRSTHLMKNTQQGELDRYRSVEIKRSSEGVVYDYSPRQQRKKEYLRKGSRIKTSIMHNILKMKLINQQTGKYGGDHQIENKQIFKLVKVYKGTLLTEKMQKKQSVPVLSEKQIRKIRQKDPLYIQGWFNDAEEYEQNENCC